jgi:acetate kinase
MKPAAPCILTINGGSSGIRFAIFEAGAVQRLTPCDGRWLHEAGQSGVFRQAG